MKKILLVVLLIFTNNLFAQTKNEEAVKTIEGIVGETIRIISGKKGVKRDWEAFRNLYTDDAKITIVSQKKDGSKSIKSITLEKFVRLGKNFYKKEGFYEYELKKTIDEYNGIAHVFQSYQTKYKDKKDRGINSYQLVFDGKRWWINNLMWTDNKNGIDIPEKYK